MSIHDQKFGELIGTVGALVTTVADMKAAIIPALKEQRLEMAKYRDDCRNAMDSHKKDDMDIHDKLETICRPIADILDWKDGDGTPEARGAEKTLNEVVNNQSKTKWVVTGWTSCIALIFAGWEHFK